LDAGAGFASGRVECDEIGRGGPKRRTALKPGLE
jgi:hypothetical protein